MNLRNLVLVSALTLSAAACGSVAANPVNTGSGYGYQATTTKSAPAPAAPAIVKKTTAIVVGKSEDILVDVQGRTLYYFTPDKGGSPTCSGACAAKWPAAMLADGVDADGITNLGGTLSHVPALAGGSQLTFNGWPLYTFAGDAAPGDTNGQGVGGKWFVVTPGLEAIGTSGMSYASGY